MGGFADFMSGGMGLGAIGKKMSLTELLFGKDEENRQVGTSTSSQEDLNRQLNEGMITPQQYMMSYLQEMMGGTSEDYEKFAAPYMRQFEEEIVPGIAERFSGMDAKSSSGFQQTMGKAGASLSENLATLKAKLRGDAVNQFQSLYGAAGKNQFNNVYHPAQRGLVQSAAEGFAQSGGKAAGSAMFA